METNRIINKGEAIWITGIRFPGNPVEPVNPPVYWNTGDEIEIARGGEIVTLSEQLTMIGDVV